MDNIKILDTFKLLGLRLRKSSRQEYIGSCPKCGKQDHLYWNVDKSLGHCKRCDESFTLSKLLEAVYIPHLEDMKPGHLLPLAKDRGLPVQAFEGLNIIVIDGEFIIPVFDVEGGLISMRRYRPGRGMTIAPGCPAELYGAQNFKGIALFNAPAFVCEGEWDAIALSHCLRVIGKQGVVVGVPGAGTKFRVEWIPHFRGREINLLYDNDEAGRNGMRKFAEAVSQHASRVQVINWPADCGEGYDIRDLIMDHTKGKLN